MHGGGESGGRLKDLMHRGTEFLGCDYAILGGAMSWISERNLVSAISNAVGFGVTACGARTPDLLGTDHHAPNTRQTPARGKKPRPAHAIFLWEDFSVRPVDPAGRRS